jgi:hypothetical protein
MPRRIMTRKITDAELAEVRDIISRVQWTHSTSPEYKDAPHSYVIKFRPLGITEREWCRLEYLTKHTGVVRSWRKYRFKYLIVDDYCYWVIWPVFNRAALKTIQPPPLT